MRQLATLLLAATFTASASAAIPRSTAERHAFQREYPCPSTGERRGSCPGYVIDHIRPLCAGGPDRRENMQWQEKAESLLKDREERRECRRRMVDGLK